MIKRVRMTLRARMTKRPRNRQFVLVVLVLIATLPGCKGKGVTPPPQAQKPQAVVAQPQKPVQTQQSTVRTQEPNITALDFTKKKDPFKPLLATEAPRAGKSGGGLPLNLNQLPIQAIDASKFKVSGIVAGINENKALIIDPNGRGYVVKRGMLIGNNNGRISKISNNAVEITEQYRDEDGHTKKRVIKLTLSLKR